MTKIYHKSSFVFFQLLLFCSVAHTQDVLQNRLDTFSVKLIKGIRGQARQQAFLITDKSIFSGGENIWLKALLLNSVSQKMSNKSKYLFIDLVDENDSVIRSVWLDAAAQQLSAKINIPAALPEGYYWLRAYTTQMAHGDSDYCAVKSIYVFNPELNENYKKPIVKSLAGKEKNSPVIIFYPEGGATITGANSTVAFSVGDMEGKPIAIEGVIKDNRDSITTHFQSNKNGLGKFVFSPSGYRQYKAYINWKGKEIAYPLPGNNFKAAQLSVAANTGDSWLLRVLLEDSIYSKDFVSYVIGVSKDSFCFAGIGRGQYEVPVPLEKFPPGIATFYLFDNNFNLLSERSFYKRNNDMKIKAVLNKNSVSTKSSVAMNISIADKNERPVPSLFAVAVVDSIFSDQDDECHFSFINNIGKPQIINNMLLAHMQCLTDEEIELIMLLRNKTFQNNSINKINSSPANEVDSLFHIKGIILDQKNEPVVHKVVTLFSNSGNDIYKIDTTDINGRFYFPIRDYPDSTRFSINVKNFNGTDQTVKVIFDTPIFPAFKTPATLKQELDEQVIKKYRKYMVTEFAGSTKERLPAVNIVSRIQKVVNYDESKRVSQYSAILSSDDIEEGSSVGNALLRISGIQVHRGYIVINGPGSMKEPSASSEPLVLVDGQQVYLPTGSADGNPSPVMGYLNTLNGKEIDFIEVLKGAEGASYGLRGGNGVILINMAVIHKDKFKTRDNILHTFYAKGLSNPSLFPVANDKKDTKPVPEPDNHSTVFWGENVLTGAPDNISFHFFTSSVPATYKVTITGITVHGDIIYKTLSFQSK